MEKEVIKYAEEIDSGSCVADFGAKCDALCDAALAAFGAKVPAAKTPEEKAAQAEKVGKLHVLLGCVHHSLCFDNVCRRRLLSRRLTPRSESCT